MLTFWDTVRGHEFADTMTRELPKLTRGKKQEVVRITDEETENRIIEEINAGRVRVQASFVALNGDIVLIIENR